MASKEMAANPAVSSARSRSRDALSFSSSSCPAESIRLLLEAYHKHPNKQATTLATTLAGLPQGSLTIMPKSLPQHSMRLLSSVWSTRLRAPSQESLPSATNVEPYKYEPLSNITNIRLLKIRKGNSDIHCSMMQPATYTSNYEALSYTWGSPTRSDEKHEESQSARVIYLDEKRFSVTNNLFDALHHLRDLGKHGYLWIDAICIDQGNVVERGHQVALMGDVYSKADRVIIWLGREDNDTREAVALMSTITPAFQRAQDEFAMAPATFLFNDLRLYALTDPVIPPLDSRQWRIVLEFFTRTWFSRVWVLQEVTLAWDIDLFCGAISLDYTSLKDFSIFMSVSRWLHDAIRYTDPLLITNGYCDTPDTNSRSAMIQASVHFLGMAHCLYEIRNARAEEGKVPESSHGAIYTWEETYNLLEQSLSYSRQLAATDPSDRVYAPLSLASSMLQYMTDEGEWVWPDYQKPHFTAFIEVGLLLLKNRRTLSLLSLVEDRTQRILQHQLPSWVPDFSVTKCTASLTAFCRYDASRHWGDIDDRDQRIFSHSLIRLLGSLHETVSKTTPLFTKDAFGNVQFHALLEVLPTDSNSGKGNEDPIDVLWRTLIGNTHNQEYPAPDHLAESFYHVVLNMMALALLISLVHEPNIGRFWDRNPLYADFTKSKLLPSESAILEETDLYTRKYFEANATREEVMAAVNPKMALYFNQLKSISCERCLISTENNHLGLAPKSTKPGDMIAYIVNSPVPVVVRALGNGTYELVGEAYIHGLMHGELGKDGPVPLEEIILQ